MMATMVLPCPRRSKGFTIDSIIGKDSEKISSPTCSQTINPKLGETENVHQDRISRKELKITNFDTVHPALHRLQASDSRDVRDIIFFNGATRDIFGAMTPMTSAKHFQETILENNILCGSSRLCRHPLSSLNGPGMYAPTNQSVSPIHPMLLNNTRDLRHMYPYLTERYPGFFLPRFGVAENPGLLFHPYRKPKRIRTAFSPSQLLHLENAFEKHHYVVGQERKDLAAELKLSETQIKVWFQNRRTKHKRTSPEDESGPVIRQSCDKDLDNAHHSDSSLESDISDIDEC
ncbi:hypothetical protein CHS0354_003350 [Potamilus streckersoni]|uniref:Homeobox domain-containing protein n=1 Tax=Potamilus streckersoni TaxID=2493646 RepID=A0AAE0S5C2_9BIVA|nr:hypothetical protein CHS0354_003350 [Potamilus streckersoni]